MIDLYFTNSSGFLQPQESGVKSIGGFISNTPIPNDYLNGLFTKISQFAQNKKGFFDMLCIAIKNTQNEAISGLSVWVENNSLYPACGFEASFVKPAINATGEQYFELIKTRKQKPLYGTPFKAVNQQADVLVFDEVLEPNKYIGLWLKRNVFVKQNAPCLVEAEIEKTETVKINFSWS